RLVDQIKDLLRQQHDADQAAQDLAGGKANHPLAAASQQQEVADKAGDLAKQSPTQVAAPLNQAMKAAAQAAKETLGGSSPKAEAARRETRQSLATALSAADHLAQQAAQSPRGSPDA